MGIAMPVSPIRISLSEYLNTSFSPDRDFLDGEVVERNAGQRKHSYAQIEIGAWFVARKKELGLQALTELRLQVTPTRVRIPDIVVAQTPLPDEEVFAEPPYLCIEIMSPDDTMASLQDRLDDYLAFGVPNVWVVDPWKFRGWQITAEGWTVMSDRIMRTTDARLALPLADVLLP